MVRRLSAAAWFVARRLALLAILLAVVFVAVDVLNGDAASRTAERGTSEEAVDARRDALGLHDPVHLRFARWVGGVFTGDLGTSARGEKVADVIGAHFPNTLLLGGIALLLTVVISLLLGCLSVARVGGRLDRFITAVSTGVLALPEFVLASALVLVLASWLGWLPSVTIADRSGHPAAASMLVLPVLALTIPQIGWNTRMVRGALADQARLPHVDAAVLDGLPTWRVLLRHVLPGAAPTIAATVVTSVGMVLGGAAAVETIFNYPGIGTVLAGAVKDRDTPVVAGITLLTGSVIFVALLTADLVRGRFERSAR